MDPLCIKNWYQHIIGDISRTKSNTLKGPNGVISTWFDQESHLAFKAHKLYRAVVKFVTQIRIISFNFWLAHILVRQVICNFCVQTPTVSLISRVSSKRCGLLPNSKSKSSFWIINAHLTDCLVFFVWETQFNSFDWNQLRIFET